MLRGSLFQDNMWFFFALITTFLWGLAELFYKKGARPEEPYAHLKTCVLVGAVMGLHAAFTLLTGDFSYNPANLLRYLPVSLLYILSMAFSFFGMRFIEESISDPIENTSGALCTLLCVIFLGASVSAAGAAAIALMAAGILGIGFLEHHGSTDRSGKLGRRLAIIAFCMPFLYALLDALGSFLDVYWLDISTSPLVDVTEDSIELAANVSYELTFAACGLLLFIYMKANGARFEIKNQRDKLLAAIFETGGQLTYVYAMSGNGALAAPVISSVCVVSLLL